MTIEKRNSIIELDKKLYTERLRLEKEIKEYNDKALDLKFTSFVAGYNTLDLLAKVFYYK